MAEKKKLSKPLIIFVVIAFIFLFVVIIATSGGDKDNTNNIEVLHGTVLDVKEYNDLAVVKVKITSSWTNELTVEQNYYNVADLIKNKGFDKYDELKYWAVGEATNGEDINLIKFTVTKDVIDKIKSDQLSESQLEDSVSDLWISNNLK